MLIKDKIKVGSFELRNRMVKAPIHSETCVDGKVTPETEQHYEERTKGGRFGLEWPVRRSFLPPEIPILTG